MVMMAICSAPSHAFFSSVCVFASAGMVLRFAAAATDAADPSSAVDCRRSSATAPTSLLKNSNDYVADRMTMFRLPNNSVPLSYLLYIVPRLSGDFGFDGEVKIDVRVKRVSRTIYLHSKNLVIKSAQICREGRKLFPSVTADAANQLLKVESQIDLEENANYTVSVEFSGTLNENMVGFYRSSYKIGNTTEWLATTQFEATFARAAFPCYDEPGYRTPFSVHVARYRDEKAISNMPLLWTSPPDRAIDNRVWDTFATSPEMPTYLVAFVVSKFRYVRDAIKNVSVYTRADAIEYSKYALKTGTKMLEQMELYTGIGYSLPKMDLVAVPDFAAGAMENWGLTTYRERYLIYDERTNSARSKQLVTQIIAHEIAHQWFGGYVTPVWWDYVWLNEAFATYLEIYAVAQVEPTWRRDEYFVTDVLQKALFADEAGYYHALTWPVKTIPQIDSLFDIITYYKGASILRMLEHMVSTNFFRDSLRTYLRYGVENGGSVTPDTLWKAFDERRSSGKVRLPNNTTIRTIMKTWTENRGYPLIAVRRIRNGNFTTISIQQRTYRSTRAGNGSTPDAEWIVPLSFVKRGSYNSASTRPSVWCSSRREVTLDNATAADEWILFNVNQTGYYRVSYDRENWRLLVDQMRTNFRLIPPLNRAQLIDDAFSLAVDEKLTFETPFALLMYFHSEDDPVPILTTLRNLIYLRNTYAGTATNSALTDHDVQTWSMAAAELQRYMIEKIDPHFQKIGFTVQAEESHVARTLRMGIVELACELEIETCVSNATDEFEKNAKNLTNIHPDLREAVLCTVLRNDLGEETWNRVWDVYRESNIPQIKQTVLASIGCSKNGTLLNRYLNLLLVMNHTNTNTNTMIRFSDLTNAFGAIFSTRFGVSTGLDVLIDLIPRMHLNSTVIDSKKLEIFVGNIEPQIRTSDDLKKLNSILLALKKLKYERFLNLAALFENVEKRINGSLARHAKTVSRMMMALRSLRTVPTSDEPGPPAISSTAESLATVSMLTLILVAVVTFVRQCANIIVIRVHVLNDSRR